nr:MAG TPA: hypothetical protein [Caudoviricetes sp.]
MIILLYISPHKFFTYFLLATLISSLGLLSVPYYSL